MKKRALTDGYLATTTALRPAPGLAAPTPTHLSQALFGAFHQMLLALSVAFCHTTYLLSRVIAAL
jgi:hypothetical protein